jgi:hypothetical protein
MKHISEELKARASRVGYTVDVQADDGTYWIPSIGHWRTIEQIEEVVAMREERDAHPCSLLH